MKAKIFINDKKIEAKDGEYIKYWEDDTKIKALDVYAWYDRIKVCLNFDRDERICYEDILSEEGKCGVRGTLKWADGDYKLELDSNKNRPVIKYQNKILPFIRRVSIHFKKGDLPNFEISGMDKESFNN